MDKHQFIQGYAERSKVAYNEAGLIDQNGKQIRVAVPCQCGDDWCNGWKMVSPEDFADMEQNDERSS